MARPTIGNSPISEFDDDPNSEDIRNSRMEHDWVNTDPGVPRCKRCNFEKFQQKKFLERNGHV